MKAAIEFLRETLARFIKENPCEIAGDCHCATCEAKHTMSATSGNYKE